MPKTVTVTYIGDESRDVSMLPSGTLRRIEPDEKFEVPEAFAESYGCQPHFFEVEGYEYVPAQPPPEGETESVEPAMKPAKKTTATPKGN